MASIASTVEQQEHIEDLITNDMSRAGLSCKLISFPLQMCPLCQSIDFASFYVSLSLSSILSYLLSAHMSYVTDISVLWVSRRGWQLGDISLPNIQLRGQQQT